MNIVQLWASGRTAGDGLWRGHAQRFFICGVHSDAVSSAQTAVVKTDSVVTCPHCHFSSVEVMPTRFSLIRFQCRNCSAVLVPKEGDDCVFCSWGDTKCPSKQTEPQDRSKTIFPED